MIYMTWLPAYDAPFNAQPAVSDLSQAYAFRLREVEGQGAVIEVEVDNPGVAGLLGRRERYAVFSERRPDDFAAVELARGRLSSVPSEFGSEFVTLEFIALAPKDEDVLRAFADGLRRDPEWGYEPLFHGRDASDEPSTAIEHRPVDWYWDRRSLRPSTSMLIEGRRLVDLGAEAFDGSISMSMEEPPVREVRRRVVFRWTQVAQGNAPSFTVTSPESQYLETATPADFIGTMPRAGSPVGSGDTGWTWGLVECTDAGPANVTGEPVRLRVTGVPRTWIEVSPRNLRVRLAGAYDYSQDREEEVLISLPLGLQSILGDDRTESVETITVAGLTTDETTPLWVREDPDTLEPMHYRVGDRVSVDGKTWECAIEHIVATNAFQALGDLFDQLGRPIPTSQRERFWKEVEGEAALDPIEHSYVDTERAMRSLFAAVGSVEREATMLARCLRVSFETQWDLGRDLTVDDAVRIRSPYVPGGTVEGKVVELELSADAGDRVARITLAVVPGIGGPRPIVTDPEEQEDINGIIAEMDGEQASQPVVARRLATMPPAWRSLHMPWDRGLGLASQRTALLANPNDPEEALRQNPTRLITGYTPLYEEELLRRRLTVRCQPLWLPRQIDLGGPA